MNNELTIVKSEKFGNIQCDFYRKDNEIFMTRDQIGAALGYSEPTIAISKLHARHSDRLNKFSSLTTLVSVDGKQRETTIYTSKGIYEVCRWSRQDKANEFMDWTWNVIDTIQQTGHFETEWYKEMQKLQEQQQQLIDMHEEDYQKIKQLQSTVDTISSNLIFQKYEPPKAKLISLEVRFCCALEMDRHTRKFYDAIQDYTGIVIPKAKDLPNNIKVYEYIFEHIPMSYIEYLVIGVEQGLIVKSTAGHWVNLNGYDNPVEWNKILDSWGHTCAYCSASESDVPLIAEHIEAQSEISMYESGRCNQISNIVPACSSCNHSKFTHSMESWFRHQKFFSEAKLAKIRRHIEKYRLEEF